MNRRSRTQINSRDSLTGVQVLAHPEFGDHEGPQAIAVIPNPSQMLLLQSFYRFWNEQASVSEVFL